MRCKVCLEGSARLVARDQWTAHEFSKIVYRCHRCRSLFVDPLPSQDQLDKVYNDPQYYTGGLAGFGYERGPADRSLGSVEAGWLQPPAGQLLDVGCGNGYALAGAIELGWNVTGLDYLRHEEIDPAIRVIVGSPLESLAALPPDYFSAITLLQVIEHSPDPGGLLTAVARVLKPDGRLILTTPNGEAPGLWSWLKLPALRHGREHLWYFSLLGIHELLKRAGLTVCGVQRRGGLGLGLDTPGSSPNFSSSGAAGRAKALGRRRIPDRLRSEMCIYAGRSAS